MSLLLPLIGLGISALGTGIQAAQNAGANKEAKEGFKRRENILLGEKHTNPLDLVENKALFTQADRMLNKSEEAVANRAAAGGATFENVLASKQASNDVLADLASGAMQREGVRQENIMNQLLNIDSQRTAQQIAAKQQSGAGWASLGNNVYSSMTTLGGTMLEHNMPLSELFKFS